MNEATVQFGYLQRVSVVDHPATVVLVTIAEGAVTNNDPADVIAAGTGDDTLGGNAKATLQFDVVAADDVMDPTRPRVVSVDDLPAVVIAPGNPDSFSFTVTLSEKPAAFTKAHIDPSGNATIDTDPVALAAIAQPTVVGNQAGSLPRIALGFIRIW